MTRSLVGCAVPCASVAPAPPAASPRNWRGAGMILLLLPAIALATFVTPPVRGGDPVTLRVLTYNIHHGEGADEKVDLRRIAAVIRSADPDLVALQEVDVKTARSGLVDQAAVLAELTGMHASFAPAMDYDGGKYGGAILTKTEPMSASTHPLPAAQGSEPRVMAEARVAVEGVAAPVTVLGTHLDHRNAGQRMAQAREIERVLAGRREEGLMILAGDLNEEPDAPTIQMLLKGWKDATAGRNLKTFPAKAPRKQIDYVLYRPAAGWRVVESRVIDEKVASDHAPVLTVFEYRPGSAPADDEAKESGATGAADEKGK